MTSSRRVFPIHCAPKQTGTNFLAAASTDGTVGSGQQSISLTGLGVAAATPTIGLSASTLSFGAQQVGTQSITQMLTLTNSGNVPVTISSVVLNGANSSDFILYGNSCVGATIAAGGTCQIGVAFKPSAVGNRSGTLLISDTAAGSPRSVALLGIGTAPTLSVSAPSLEFGAIQVGTTSGPQTVTLTNNSSGAVSIINATVNGLNATDFAKTLDTCAATTLAPGAACSITVRFSPQAGGTRTGGLLVTIGSGSPLTIGLNGTGVTAQVTFEPSSLSFGTQPLTTMSTFQTVRLTNGGSGTLTINSVGLFGGDMGDFVVAGDTCSGGTLGPNGSCQVNVAFRPTAIGNRLANLTFSTNVGNGTQTVSLQGVGTTTPTPSIQLGVQGLTFTPQQVGTQSAIQSVSVTNSGTANLVITTASITGTNSVDFLKTGDNCAGTTLQPGASCSLGVRFAPTQAGNRTASLVFATNAGTGSQSISLVGTGVTATVHLSATSFQFGQQPVGVPSTGQMLQVTNTGNGTLVIQSVLLGGVNATDFIKNGDTCAGATLAPGLGCTIGVIFRPNSIGNKTASLLISDNAPGAPREIILTGEGIQNVTPSVSLSANSLSFGTIQVGNVSGGQSLIVTNTGQAPLRITAVIMNGTNAGDFLKTGDTCGNAIIEPGNFCSIGIIFRPTAAGVRIASLILVDDAAGSPREITLTGTGLTGAVGLSTPSLDFGGWTISTPEKSYPASSTQTLTVTNTGQGSLTLGSVAVTGPNTADWLLLANTCVNATVAPGSNCQIGVAFKPTALGDRSATLTIANTAAGSVHNVALLGTGLLPQPRYKVTLTLSSLGCNGTIAPAGGEYEDGTEVTLTVTPGSDFVFLGWRVNGLAAGWASPLTITVTRDTAVEAVCTPKQPFVDTAGNPYLQAIYELTARGVIRGYGDGRFGPNDTTQRAQMAAFIARAMGWDLENHGNPFNDQNGNDPNLWRNVGTLAYYGVAFGYGDGKFAPNDLVTRAQTISFVTRAMVVKGYWQRQPDNPALFPDVPASSGHRIDIATYYHYIGSIPEVGSTSQFAAWSQPSNRAWFSEVLWRALNGYFGRDTAGNGGYIP